jgi:predicted enzyme related to lactoylglutathione lyase
MKKLVWFEIRTNDFIKSIDFYENVLNISMEIKHLHQKRVALFDASDLGMPGCIIESDKEVQGNGTVLFFKVENLSRTVEKLFEYGGTIITKPFLVKQKDMDGNEITGKNLFDDSVGYLTEVNDPDGNTIFIYASSQEPQK